MKTLRQLTLPCIVILLGGLFLFNNDINISHYQEKPNQQTRKINSNKVLERNHYNSNVESNIQINNVSPQCVSPGETLSFDVTTRLFYTDSDDCNNTDTYYNLHNFRYEFMIGDDVITFTSNSFDANGIPSDLSATSGTNVELVWYDTDYDNDDVTGNINGPTLSTCDKDDVDNRCDCNDPQNPCPDSNLGNGQCEQQPNDAQHDWFFRIEYTVPNNTSEGTYAITGSETFDETAISNGQVFATLNDSEETFPAEYQEGIDVSIALANADAGEDDLNNLSTPSEQESLPLDANTPDDDCVGTWSGGPAGTTFSNENDPNATVTFPAGTTGSFDLTWTVDCLGGGGSCTESDTKTVSFIEATNVSGLVYEDTNGNGTQDSSEPLLENITINITDTNGNPILDSNGNPITTETLPTLNGNGDNWSVEVPADTDIVIDIVDGDKPNGSTQTEGNDPTQITTGTGNFNDGGTDGFFTPATLTGTVYYDENNNAAQDNGELGIEGVDMEITDSNGNTQTVTTNSDGIWTVEVPPGQTTADLIQTSVVTVTNSGGSTVTDEIGNFIQTEGGDPTVTGVVANQVNNGGNDGFFISTLPIELSQFELEKLNEQTINIRWTTETEINNDYFELYYSLGGKEFELLTTKNAVGSSSNRKTYQYVHENVHSLQSAVIYYQLKQIDLDGKSTESKIISVSINHSKTMLSVFPVPARIGETITINGEDLGSYSIYTLSGELVKEVKQENNQHSISVETTNLAAGTYVIELSSQQTVTVIIQ